MSYRVPDSYLPGYQTLVTERSKKDLPPASSYPVDDSYPKRPDTPVKRRQVLPLPSEHRDQREIQYTSDDPPHPPVHFQVPPTRDKAPGEKSLSKDRVRTPGEPGEEYGHPYSEYRLSPKRRPYMTGSFYYEKKPVEHEPGTWWDRAKDRFDKYFDLSREDEYSFLPINPDRLVVPDSGSSAKVIPWNSDMVNKKANETIPGLEKGTEQLVHNRSRRVPVQLVRVDRRNAMWHYRVRGNTEPYYLVKVKMPPEGNVRNVNLLDLEVSCSCPYWRWQGPEYHGRRRKYLYGRPRGTASNPRIRDPQGRHLVCKHVLAVFDNIQRMGKVRPEWGKKASSRNVVVRYLGLRGGR